MTGTISVSPKLEENLCSYQTIAIEEFEKCIKFKQPTALYLFAGLKRKSDVASFLEEQGWAVTELDIMRSKDHDLSRNALREKLLAQVRAGDYTAILASPPCDTFSRVKFANDDGPRPTRTADHPRGFEWVIGEKKKLLNIGNILADFTFKIVQEQAKTHPGLAVIEFPEDLGAVSSGRWRGIKPASIWQWPEMKELRKIKTFREMGIRQSDFGAEYLKPTRIVMLAEPDEGTYFEGPPCYDKEGYYLGPVPKSNPAMLGLKALAKKRGEHGFRTTGTAAWPAQLCKWLANSLHKTLLKERQSYEGKGDQSCGLTKQGLVGKEDYPTTVPPDNYWKGGKGEPRTTYTLGKVKDYHDGCGLTSPGRWRPEQRTYPEGARWEILRESLYNDLISHKEGGKEWGKEGIQRTLLRLCCSKEIVAFPEKLILKGRATIMEWLGRQCGDYNREEPEIAERQPFVLKGIHLLLREMRDPDYRIIDQMKDGVTAGILFPLPRTPAVFEEQTKWRLKQTPSMTPCTSRETMRAWRTTWRKSGNSSRRRNSLDL